MQRRTFLSRLSITVASVAGALIGFSYLKQLVQGRKRTGKRIKLGALSDFPLDTYTYNDEAKVFVYRDHEAVKAISAVCTHLGCTVQHTTEGFQCPCHGSCYTDEGKVISGPTVTPLAWYKMERAPDGRLVVDLSKKTDAEDKLPIA